MIQFYLILVKNNNDIYVSVRKSRSDNSNRNKYILFLPVDMYNNNCIIV